LAQQAFIYRNETTSAAPPPLDAFSGLLMRLKYICDRDFAPNPARGG